MKPLLRNILVFGLWLILIVFCSQLDRILDTDPKRLELLEESRRQQFEKRLQELEPPIEYIAA